MGKIPPNSLCYADIAQAELAEETLSEESASGACLAASEIGESRKVSRPLPITLETADAASGQECGHRQGPDLPSHEAGLPVLTPDLARAICQGLAEGRLLSSICARQGMPPAALVREWVMRNEADFATQYQNAMKRCLERWAEEILEIADDCCEIQAAGRKDEIGLSREYLQRARLRIEARKWLITRTLPQIYGSAIPSESILVEVRRFADHPSE